MFAHHPRNIFIHKNRRSSLSFLAGILVVGGLFFYSHLAKAVPSYARQTEQSCVACHAGGQFPELTPYGRKFKLLGYTMGQQANPFSAMLVIDYSKLKNNTLSDGSGLTQKDAQWLINQGSVFIAGKVTNNIGLFSQFTYAPYDHQNDVGKWVGHAGSDNFDLRYADQNVTSSSDLIWGLTFHNNITVQDPWNTVQAWGYPYMTRAGAFSVPNDVPYATALDGPLGQFAGTGAYLYLNNNIYLELTGYQTAKNAFSVLSMGSHAVNSNGSVLTYIDGIAPYARVAYTKEWGPHNVMLGASYLDIKVYPFTTDVNNTNIATDFSSGVTHYQDKAIDGQYQYLLSPHTITAQFRYVRETIRDQTGTYATTAPVNLNSFRAKMSYIYQAKYGASLAYKTVTGDSDTLAYVNSSLFSPNSTLCTREIFWIPVQNMRVGLQYNYFTKYAGASNNYDGAGRNAKDNNSTYIYLWMAY